MAQEIARVLGNTEINNWIPKKKKVKEFLEQLRNYKSLFVRRPEHEAITKICLRKTSLVWTYESREKNPPY